MRLSLRLFTLLLVFVCLPLTSAASSQQTRDKGKEQALQQQQQEEMEDYYRKWLTEDVVYIITDEEKAVFEKLTTPEEKERFIEQFWRRRDPDVKTAVNEFKEEHYRRIAYANEKFTSGQAGWLTDRGRVYIIHGPPDEIENHGGGGHYIRPEEEGGGTTATYAFEKWRYRHIDGIGDNVVLEFVDKTFTDEYRLAQTPFEKDLLLNFPGMGLTRAEELGLADRAHHPYHNPANYEYRERYPFMEARYGDTPFARYERYERIQAPPALKYKDLKQLVDVNITYLNLPFDLRIDYFRLNDRQSLVPITVEFSNNELSYEVADGIQTAKVAIYGLITSIRNEVIQEFEDDVMSSFRVENREAGLRKRSLYQKMTVLDRTVRYKLDLVVKDLRSGKTGVISRAIVPPPDPGQELRASSVILTNVVQSVPDLPDNDEMFVLGNLRILPNLTKRFSNRDTLNVYLQVYGAQLDQTTFEPSLQIKYRIVQKNDPKGEFIDTDGHTIQFFSPRRVVLLSGIPVQELNPGRYRVIVEITDLISRKVVSVQDEFELKEPLMVATSR